MSWLLLAAALLVSPAALGAERAFRVEAAESLVRVSVSRAGLFAFLGHTHEVVTRAITGRIVADPDDLGRSSVALRFDAAGLQVTGKGEPAEDVPKVQARMQGVEVLDVARFAEISFQSTSVEGREAGGTFNLRLTGELKLRDVTRPSVWPVRVTVVGDRLEALGQAVIRHSDFGLKPISIAGVVKVKNELGCDYKIVARAEP